ncbi:DNA polymerase domain-containing protein [Haliscomenobacter sp.]|uniref:DNA polymerase domain-containing protein n=1 Tax=Haliscomenobacter sp. TaxID=2717303 RepID=UPI0033652054
MSYIDSLFDRAHDRIHVVERRNGTRVYREYPANFVFYYDDPRGKHRSIYDTPVSRFSTRNNKEFRKEVSMHSSKQLYESDINPIFRCLEDNYKGQDAPDLHTAFFDIEVDFNKDRGFSPVDDPFNPITAISVYLNWLDQMVTMAVPPKHMSMETAQELVADFENTFLFEDERDMIKMFLDLIDDADVLSGWNSEGYDIPYTINRTIRVLSKDDTRKFCLWGQHPKKRMFERFGAEQETYDLVGRVHMDYMQLYRKYTYEERHSYSLDAIAEYELGEHKTQFEGTLDQLYNQHFKKFIEYNRQDTALLDKLDRKLRFLELASELAHANTVLLQTTMGAVAVTEQAIIVEAHERGFVVPNRKQRNDTEDNQAAGAYVAYPKKGLHEWVGSVDINSLYPSAIRAQNMGPETIVGQLRQTMTDHYIKDKMAKNGGKFADAWENLFGSLEYTAVMNTEIGTEITIDWQDGSESSHSAAEIWKLIFDSHQPWILTANGTIITYEKKGIIPGLLERWYSERKDMQAKKKAATDPKDIAFWDKRQLVKKINLNSLYGAILNPGCRFFDKRIGQSTTLTGRAIARHMDAYINECITGKYDHVGEAVIYGDTDSCYFSAWSVLKNEVAEGRMEWSKETCIQLYDSIADQVNDSFPGFMEQAFHCPRDMGELIKCGREMVADRSLFITKKRYAVNIIDLEGNRLDVNGKIGKTKATGLDLKRSDTPKVIQEFLLEILNKILSGVQRDDVIEHIRKFKYEFRERPGWEKGSPKRVNNLTKYGAAEAAQGRANMPGHVRAALNWNNMRRMNSDNYSMQIVDGMKTIVCKLKSNALGWTSIGYPTDEQRLPAWFTELPFDDGLMEATVVDQKIDNLLGVLEWDLASATNTENTFTSLFSFE